MSFKNKNDSKKNIQSGSLAKLFKIQHQKNEEFYKPHNPTRVDGTLTDDQKSGVENCEQPLRKENRLSLKRKQEFNTSLREEAGMYLIYLE